MAKTKTRKYPLKAWAGPAWQRQLSKTLTVSRVDEDIPTPGQPPTRKPWRVALTQTWTPDVKGLPAGTSVVLSEDEVLALVAYLFEPQTAMWIDDPSATDGEHEYLMFLEPGMVAVADEDGTLTAGAHVVNGEAHWAPKYFERVTPVATLKTSKGHTLPWPLPPARASRRLAAGKRRHKVKL